ncbi:myeloid leukemia factor isoform X2 [Condylostylus longicornis]|uniref:myeloid leukemia factor isoform X2 n=1 Tax=Condylostylus longicornis TaxID=2530218 RepID=UPI00244DC852|nr:myeloid leukemia factor isoform X2 [Condylostylus longicornis]
MSLFGSLLGDCDDDLFFGQHMRQMNSLMGSLMPDPFNMLTPFDNFGSNTMRAPMGGLFGFPGIPNLNRLLSGDIPENNGASYCSSSVIQMTSGPDGRPQVYQATSTSKTGPGGVRETRKTVQDSRTGLKKMAIGHHIGERAHIIEREQNVRSGEQEERQEFINLDEEEAETFDREFTNKARGNRSIEITAGPDVHRHYGPSNHQRQLLALPAPPTSSQSSAAKNTSTSSDTSDTSINATNSTTTAINSKITSDNKSTTSSFSSPLSSSAQRRQLLSSRNVSKVSSRRPLRTPSSSPLASNTPSSARDWRLYNPRFYRPISS